MQYELDGLSSLAQGQSRLYQLGGNKYLVYHLSDGFYATDAKCTHLFKSLANGVIVSDAYVRCPLHKAEFDIRTGEVKQWACFPPGIQLMNALRREKVLNTYAISENDGRYFLHAAC